MSMTDSTSSQVAEPHFPKSDEEKVAWLRLGRVIEYPKTVPPSFDAAAWDRVRTVRAETLLALFADKSKPCSVPIRLRHVIVEGDLRVNYAVCLFEVSIKEDSTFTSDVNFSYTKFQGVLDLRGATFAKGFKLDSASCSFDLQLDQTNFNGEASFARVSVEGRLTASGARFKKKASFGGLGCSKVASFHSLLKDHVAEVTTFEDEANFSDSKWDATIGFDGVQFCGKLDFGRSVIEGNALFRPALLEDGKRLPVHFKGPVSFTDSSIGGSAVFDSTEFDKDAEWRRSRIGRGLYLRGAKFGPDSKASFENIQIDGPVAGDGVHFGGACSFEAAQIKGNAVFRCNLDRAIQTKFLGGLNFRDSSIGGNANFGGAQFYAQKTEPEPPAADFSRSHIGGAAFFGSIGRRDGKIFESKFVGKAFFDDISIEGTAGFAGCRFSSLAQFRRVQVGSSAFFATTDVGGKLAGTHFAGASDFREGHFHGSIDFSGAYFGGNAIWDRSVIEGAVFFRPVFIDPGVISVAFAGSASFRDAQISGVADFSGSDFCQEANFIRAKFGSSLFFSALKSPGGELVPTRFGGGLKMFRCQIAGDLAMDGSQHEALAELESVQVQGTLLCRAAWYPEIEPVRVKFGRGARFFAAIVNGTADFSGSDFEGSANFGYIKVGGSMVFRPPPNNWGGTSARFKDANFSGAIISGGAEFEGVHFAKSARFQEARIGGTFRIGRVEFGDRADFRRFEVQGDAHFSSVSFDETDFEGSHFGKLCQFDSGSFLKGLNFSRVRVDGLLILSAMELLGAFRLEDSSVSGVTFELDQEKSSARLNLKGFTFGRLNGDWRDLFRLIPDDPEGKSHLQAYTQLERYFRSVGYERDADDVYVARRNNEWQLLRDGVFRHPEPGASRIHSLFRFLEDSVVRYVFHYGMPSYRLIGVAFVLFLFGVAMLSLPCAVRRGDMGIDSSSLTFLQRVVQALAAFSASVIPGASKITDLRPSFERIYMNGLTFTQGSASLGLLIYTCVSVSLASLAGLIKRKQA
jgi:uncharacterized protein YjbI with pentapeptide repeats